MKNKGKRGISLIVLVITIIIMIILAAAVILSLNSSNVVNKASEARDKSDMANARNIVAVATAEWELMSKEEKLATPYNNSFSKYAGAKLQNSGYVVGTTAGAYEVTDKGGINVYPTIPEGFKASIYTGENTVASGLVIYETNNQLLADTEINTTNRDAARTTYNQYVWIPVYDINEFIKKDFEKGLTGASFSECTEPFNKAYNGVTLSMTNDLTGEYAEYSAMRASVEKYGGFYIGRYEAGKENNALVVKKGMAVWNSIAWGASMVDIGTSGAVYKSRNMYLNTNVIKDSVVSHLIYAVEWDAAVKFISTEKNILDNTSWGNYSNNPDRSSVSPNNPAKTGAHENWKAKNVYDMGGNVFEWTMEAYNTTSRVLRGGSYNYLGTPFTAAFRGGNTPGVTVADYGFRVALYIK